MLYGVLSEELFLTILSVFIKEKNPVSCRILVHLPDFTDRPLEFCKKRVLLESSGRLDENSVSNFESLFWILLIFKESILMERP
jgi:hypothetical protein